MEIDKTKKKLLKIGELAGLSGESVATIRYWTREGLLVVRERTVGGYTLYEKEMVERIKKIRKLQKEKRLSVAELRHFAVSNNKIVAEPIISINEVYGMVKAAKKVSKVEYKKTIKQKVMNKFRQ